MVGCTTTPVDVEVPLEVASEEITGALATETTGEVGRSILALVRISRTATSNSNPSHNHIIASKALGAHSAVGTKATLAVPLAEGGMILGYLMDPKTRLFLLVLPLERKTKTAALLRISRLLVSRSKTWVGAGGLCPSRLRRQTKTSTRVRHHSLLLRRTQSPKT